VAKNDQFQGQKRAWKNKKYFLLRSFDSTILYHSQKSISVKDQLIKTQQMKIVSTFYGTTKNVPIIKKREKSLTWLL